MERVENSGDLIGKVVIGIDISDKSLEMCFLYTDDQLQQVKLEQNSPEHLSRFFEHNIEKRERRDFIAVMETGTHSNWISDTLKKLGIKSYILDARRLSLISRSLKKTDRNDAESLARLSRIDLKLLNVVRAKKKSTLEDLMLLKLREALVRERTSLYLTVVGLLKSFGFDTQDFTVSNVLTKCKDLLSEANFRLIQPFLLEIERKKETIKFYDKELKKLEKKYPAIKLLQTIDGVGQIGSTAFVLIVEECKNFENGRRLGSYLGLVPKRDQSGEMDKQLGITKSGDSFMRKTLIQEAQYILSRGKDSELKEFGERLCARGGKTARKKAVVALARKLATIMLSMWKNNAIYDPFFKRNSKLIKQKK